MCHCSVPRSLRRYGEGDIVVEVGAIARLITHHCSFADLLQQTFYEHRYSHLKHNVLFHFQTILQGDGHNRCHTVKIQTQFSHNFCSISEALENAVGSIEHNYLIVFRIFITVVIL